MAAPLPNKIRRFITMRLAQFQHPKLVADEVFSEFGITVSIQRVMRYDPTKYGGQGLSATLKEAFYEYRAQHVVELDNFPLAHRSVRLERLNELYWHAYGAKNVKAAISAIAVAQRDMADLEMTEALKPGEGA